MIARDRSQVKQLPYAISIGGHTDSVSVEEIMAAGRPVCLHNAFEIVSFTIAIGGNCLGEGLYTEVGCPSATFTDQAIFLIRRLSPGARFFTDNVRVKNKAGEEFLLKSHVFWIKAGKK